MKKEDQEVVDNHDENIADKRQKIRELYRYDEMSNKVIDRRDANAGEAGNFESVDSKPASMIGKVSIRDMGMNAIVENDTNNKHADINLDKSTKTVKTEGDESKLWKSFGTSTLLEAESFSKINYYPTDEENSIVYEDILQWVVNVLGSDIQHEAYVETVDILITLLKRDRSDSVKQPSKLKMEVDEALALTTSDAEFQSLIKLTNKITDFDERQNGNGDDVLAVAPSDDDNDDNNDENIDDGTNGASVKLNDKMNDLPIIDNFENGDQDTSLLSLNVSVKETIFEAHAPTSDITKLKIDEICTPALEKLISHIMHEKKISPSKLAALAESLLNLICQPKCNKNDIIKICTTYLNCDCDELVKLIIENQDVIKWGTILSKSPIEEREGIYMTMTESGYSNLVAAYKKAKNDINSKRTFNEDDDDNSEIKLTKKTKVEDSNKLRTTLNLDDLVARFDSQKVEVSAVKLPKGSFKKATPHYEEFHIPAPDKPKLDFDLVGIDELPEWSKAAFPSDEIKRLNVIQSKVYPSVFETDSNILLCAPTGAGKTNIALLSILRCLSHYINKDTGKLYSKNFKAVYIAPLKALVQEQVKEFKRRLSFLDIEIAELTGDSNLSRKQIADTQVLIATPEKWDIITRKSNELSFLNSVKLIIIDEVHLLNDERGPVIEAIVARYHGNEVSNPPRVIALSATLPNYEDVAKFLRVPQEGLFFFDQSYRPCPLIQQFCGVTEKSSVKRLSAVNEACYNKVLEAIEQNHQVIVFVHSRKETAATALYIEKKLNEHNKIHLLLKDKLSDKEILKRESENVTNSKLKSVIKSGIGIHHAGLNARDRSLSEDLFADGLLQVLISTATLAWGVNLPAHTVIIKGTDVYSPILGAWTRLSSQDMLQMLGRAGRPRYDNSGEGVIITNQTDVQYYLAALNEQLPIESQLIKQIINVVNAEVVMRNIASSKEGIKWLKSTYLYVRLIKSDLYYDKSQFHDLDEFIKTLLHSVFQKLHEQKLARYDNLNDRIEATEFGRIASHYYIDHDSMYMYSRNLNSHSNLSEILDIFSKSHEFKFMKIRPEERREVKELHNKCPIPLKSDNDDDLSKINVLMQSFISRLNFDGFALNADMIYLSQNAGRLIKAMYEMCLSQKWSKPTKLLLSLSKSISRKMWMVNAPIRQFVSCPIEVIRKIEASNSSWLDYMSLSSPAEVGKAIRSEKHGKLVYDLARCFPQVNISCNYQPLTPNVLSFEVDLTPEWIWDNRYHQNVETFIMLIEDSNGENILHSQIINFEKARLHYEHTFSFFIDLSELKQSVLPPNLFINVISERWIGSQMHSTVSLDEIVLPKKFPQPMIIEGEKLISTTDLNSKEFEQCFPFTKFNRIISSVFDQLYNSDENVLLCSTCDSNKFVAAELTLLHNWRQNKGRAMYISNDQQKIDDLYQNWNKKFSNLAGGKVINKLGDDSVLNYNLLATSHLIMATPSQISMLSRRWRQRKNIRSIELIIYDDIHEISNSKSGAIYEIVVSRMSLIFAQVELQSRIIALSSCLANPRDVADWLNVKKAFIFNYSPKERSQPVNLQIQSFLGIQNDFYSQQMKKEAYELLGNAKKKLMKTIMVFPSRKTIFKFLSHASLLNDLSLFDYSNNINTEVMTGADKIKDLSLKKALGIGYGILYKEMCHEDKLIVNSLYNQGKIDVIFCTFDYTLDNQLADQLIVFGTKYYDGNLHCFQNYSPSQIKFLIENVRSSKQFFSVQVLIMTEHENKPYYKRFINDALPIESYLLYNLPDFILNEINSKIVETKQDCVDLITYSYFYRRLHSNPSFYGVTDTSNFGISSFLTGVVENVLKDLESSMLVEMEERSDEEEPENLESIKPTIASMICSNYDISHLTVNRFVNSISSNSKLKDMLLFVSGASEFSSIKTRKEDYGVLTKLQARLPLKFNGDAFNSQLKFKIFILLQAHFSRLTLPIELKYDLDKILVISIRIINSLVDLLSSNGYLNAIPAMDLSQMLVQAVWDSDSPVKQIPFFDESIMQKCSTKDISTVYDIMALEDDERDEIMTMDQEKLQSVAMFVNNYPNIDLQYAVNKEETFHINKDIPIKVIISKDEEPENLLVTSEKYPHEKLESWWIVLGEAKTKELYAIKKVSLSNITQEYTLSTSLNVAGQHELTIWCICDSYLDADKEVTFTLTIKE